MGLQLSQSKKFKFKNDSGRNFMATFIMALNLKPPQEDRNLRTDKNIKLHFHSGAVSGSGCEPSTTGSIRSVHEARHKRTHSVSPRLYTQNLADVCATGSQDGSCPCGVTSDRGDGRRGLWGPGDVLHCGLGAGHVGGSRLGKLTGLCGYTVCTSLSGCVKSFRSS